jgi:hypothetical protein
MRITIGCGFQPAAASNFLGIVGEADAVAVIEIAESWNLQRRHALKVVAP